MLGPEGGSVELIFSKLVKIVTFEQSQKYGYLWWWSTRVGTRGQVSLISPSAHHHPSEKETITHFHRFVMGLLQWQNV